MITIKSFEINYLSENTRLPYDDAKEAVLIDYDCLRKEEQKEVSDFTAQNGLMLKRYPCTYLHLGHVFGNEFIHDICGLSPEAHRAGMEGLPSPEGQARTFDLSIKAKSVLIGKYLVNGEIIKFGKSKLAVLSVPGYSPGGMAFYSKKDGFVTIGDSLFVGSTDRTDLWENNQDILLAATKDGLLLLPGEIMVYSGHGPETRIIDGKLNNPYL